ncbi:hypothetical protein DFP93_11163 [Aneurinibacillus soli]|uniref:Uncharacterized protein n=1 Tax=Aneurinibacillus soli TaxID=1500254 RepID=A0A0U5B995_9BACL|nr:hypothetical protein [Aneurinibacillus soli]PYE60886.1 hypothetical protein DFP93_11163 [Aneurinibacillus soli]BAU26791.1 hypothetical protein CB4_00960 [Aneurinibacillus soli]
MVKLRVDFLVGIFMLTFVMVCTSNKSSQTFVESSEALVDNRESSKETNESWITSELSTYKFQVPSSSKTMTEKDVKDTMSFNKVERGFCRPKHDVKRLFYFVWRWVTNMEIRKISVSNINPAP